MKRWAAEPIAPSVGHRHFVGDGQGATAYVSAVQNPEQHRRGFDAAATIALLQRAIKAIENGDGVAAVKLAGAAWFRISIFHHS